MIFKRKVYQKLLEWKQNYADNYAVLLEGARRVGKTTIVKEFAKKEYRSFIIIDFSITSKEIKDCFEDLNNLDLFFLRLQTIFGVTLYTYQSLIVFDEVQLFPRARQAIKHLIADGRYHYIETGSLISIKKNVKDILIPSEELRIQLFPMDYEEFCDAIGRPFSIYKQLFEYGKPLGQIANRQAMRDFRIYMAVGGMPQAVDAYIKANNFEYVDKVKRGIISLYEEDFKKIDSSGRLSAIYHSIPAQLSNGTKRFNLTTALNKRKNAKDENLLFDLIDSKTVLPCYNTTDPRVSLSLTKDLGCYKLYLADTGLFTTLMFIDRPFVENELYSKLLSDKLPANLGYLYENVVAQMIASFERELYYHTWNKTNSTHYYEIDFLISKGTKVSAFEVKSSATKNHESIDEFCRKYSDVLKNAFVISQKDRAKDNKIDFIPLYMTQFLL